MKYLFVTFILFFSVVIRAQDTTMVSLPHDVYRGDTLPDVDIPAIVVYAKPDGYYVKLRRDVYRAYPYALRAASILEQIEGYEKDIKKKRHRKRFLKKRRKQLREEFEDKLRKLTKRQGRIMIRLINRETDGTVYEYIKHYQSGISARFWQIMAKRYDADLKAEYDPDNVESEDFDIEYIVEGIEKVYKRRYLNEVKVKKPTYRDFQP